MTSKHTPGPWIAQPGENFITDGQDIVVCEMHRHHDDGQVDSNARLIASAPDLLAALVSVDLALAADLPTPGTQNLFGETYTEETALAEIRLMHERLLTVVSAAIAKAEGR